MGVKLYILSPMKQNVSNELDRYVLRIMWSLAKESSEMDSLGKGTESPKQYIEKSEKKIKRNIAVSSVSSRKANTFKLKTINLKMFNAFLDDQFISRNFKHCAMQDMYHGKQKKRMKHLSNKLFTIL